MKNKPFLMVFNGFVDLFVDIKSIGKTLILLQKNISKKRRTAQKKRVNIKITLFLLCYCIQLGRTSLYGKQRNLNI